MKFETRFETLKLADIIPAPYNPREDIEPGTEEYKRLRKSLEDHGMVEPPVVNIHNMRCIGGNEGLPSAGHGRQGSPLLCDRPAG